MPKSSNPNLTLKNLLNKRVLDDENENTSFLGLPNMDSKPKGVIIKSVNPERTQ